MPAHASGDGAVSPWRPIFEQVRGAVGSRRDERGVLGSINWLRQRMASRGANPNVVRNIIYRDKGRVQDKRVLFEILRELWAHVGQGPLHAPELEALLSPAGDAEQEVLQLLGRDKRRAFRAFVDAVREGRHPKLLLTGRPGSGKTMLADYVGAALPERVVRAELGGGDLGTGLTRLGVACGVPRAAMEARLAKIGSSGAYAVQADAQADVARAVLDAVREETGGVLLLHVSRPSPEHDALGTVPLRLNTPDVPRVSASEWLWVMLLEPLSREPDASVLVSMSELPARASAAPGGYTGPLKLTPPTAAEARRFVKARLPHLPAAQHEEVARRAGRSFEELRTLTLLTEIRAPLTEEDAAARVERLAGLVTNGNDARLTSFLSALAVVAVANEPAFRMADLTALRPEAHDEPSELELAFVDPVPGVPDGYRPFSRAFVGALRDRLIRYDRERYRALHAAAAERLREEAGADPASEAAARRLHHLHAARAWEALIEHVRRDGIHGALVGRVWRTAQEELDRVDVDAFERVARQVATHYVKLGSYHHPDAVHACGVLMRSDDPRRRAWATLKQAEGAVLRGRHDQAEALVGTWPSCGDGLLAAEAALVRASIARFRGDLARAAAIVDEEAAPAIAALPEGGAAERLARAKVAIGAGLIRKDRGDLEGALLAFDGGRPDDDLLRARLAFHSADVLMALGRARAAGERFDRAVDLSRRSGALVSERARYLARRASLQRRRGRLDDARADLDAADAILRDFDGDGLELEVWATRVDEQRALLLLAHGRHDEAIGLLADCIERIRACARTYGFDATYSTDRARLRLAVAHGARALGAAWMLPFPHRPPEPFDGLDLVQARRLLSGVLARLERPHAIPRADPLGRRALLVSSLLEPPVVASKRAERALELSRFAYPRAEARVHLAAAHLRAADVAASREALDAAATELADDPAEAIDPGLRAWLAALRLRTHVSADAPAQAMAEAARLLSAPLPESMRAAALRAFGEALEVEDRVAWLDRPDLPDALAGGPGDGALRPGDLLVSRAATRRSGALAPPRTAA